MLQECQILFTRQETVFFICHKKGVMEIQTIKKDFGDFDTVELYALADVHMGDMNQDKKRLKQFITEVKEQRNRFVIVNGDIVNLALRHSVSDIYSEEYPPNIAIDKTVELLQEIKDRIVVVTEGNHEARAYKSDGILVMDRVTKELQIPETYSAGAYLIFATLGKNRGSNHRKTSYAIYGKHSNGGGGRRVGGKANKLEDMAGIIDADIYIVSHTHQVMAFRKDFFRCNYRNQAITLTEKLFINTNAFLGYGGYGEEHGYTPASTRYPKLILDGYERNSQVLL